MTDRPRPAVLADDFTGAAEVAAALTNALLPARVAWHPREVPPAEFLVLDAATRPMPRPAALQRLADHLQALQAAGRTLAYKKIDSTLRGHLGPELAVSLAALHLDRVLLCPAYPVRGRTVREGELLVDGRPLADTPFAQDPACPPAMGRLPEVLAGQGYPPAARIGLDTVRQGPPAIAAAAGAARGILLADAETEADLSNLAGAVALLGPGTLPAGSAGLLIHLPPHWGAPAGRPVLTVVGSLHPAAREQVQVLARQGARVVVVDPAGARQAGREAAGWLGRGSDVVLMSPGDRRAGAFLGSLGQACVQALVAAPGVVAGLSLAGGETSRSVLEALGARSLAPVDQVEEGVPVGRADGGLAGGALVVTKAGGLGTPDMLVRAARRLRRLAPAPAPLPAVAVAVAERPLVAITAGDLAGVGPEVALKAVQDPGVRQACRPVLVGDAPALAEWARRLDLPVRPVAVADPREELEAGAVPVIHVEARAARGVAPGTLDPACGRAAVAFVERAVALARGGRVGGMATGPIHKEAIRQAGIPFPGHTELLQSLTGAPEVAMLLVAGSLRVVHVSTHQSLRSACDQVQALRVLAAIRLLDRACRDLGVDCPCIAVAGLNPHAGENGLFGQEDREQIAPAVAAARAQGLDAHGPVPPDTVFLQALRGQYHGVVAMYHDQGHIPVKLLGFAQAVNVTLGLPIVRTSVDHGTAFDIAGKGLADPGSMVEAIKLAAALSHRRE